MNKIYQRPKIFSLFKKSSFLAIISFLIIVLTAGKSEAQTTLTAGDIAIIGFNTDATPDDMVILVLKDLSAGTVFYVNDNEVLTAGGTSFADLNEAEASFTVKAGQSIPKGTVIVLPWGGGLTSTTTYDWNVTAGAGLGNAEEIYVYNATSITSLTPTSFIFGVTQGANTGLRPNGLTAGTTWIDHGTSRAYRYNTTGATYSGTQTQLLAAIGNAANHTGAATYTFAPSNWTFTVTSGTPAVNLSVSANAGTEAGTTAITVTATASATVTGAQTVSLAVTGTNITAGDYTLSNATITIPNGSTTGTVTFTVVNDILVEGTETATLTISSPSAGITLGATTTQNITITDNDLTTPHTLAFVRVDTTVTEAAGTARVFLRVTAAGNSAGTVDLAVSNYSTATGSGTDYTVPVTLNVPANLVLNQLISFDFTINDDAVAEADEYIICKLTNASNVTVSSTAQSTLYIKDNDKATPVATNQLNLNFVTSFSNGATGTNSAEISAYDSGSKRLFIANSIANKLDIVSLVNPAAPVLITSINLAIAPFNGSINSVDVRNGIVALALEGLTDKQANGKVVFTDINGVFISEVAAGAMPDMITFNHAGTKVYTANEGEPNAAYTNDPLGSVTIVNISGGAASATAVTIDFTAYNGQEATLRSQGIRIYGLNASAAQDFEPEYITISDDDSKAWVTLQENNALVELDLTNNSIVKLIPLGYKDHSLTNNALDVSDQTFGINLSNYPFKGMYLPDAIASYTSAGNIYLITANEGDARAYSGFNEESRVSGLTLDPTIFPNSADLKNNGVLGRLNATNKSGDIDNDGDIDEIYVYGTRSFSIWNPATSTQVYDSKDDLERITANDPANSAFFNMSNTTTSTVKNRSDDKGPEPEGVTIAKIGGRDYAFVALERIGGVIVYDVTNPAAPVYVSYANNRTATTGDRGSEGIIFVPAAESPNGKSLVILSNEVSSTVSIYEIAPCTAAGIAVIANEGSTTACAGNTIKLFNVNSNAAYTYQWLKNGTTIAGATDSVYLASQSGDYKLVVFNAAGCVDTSSAITLSIEVDVIAPSITAPAAVSVATTDGCSASGFSLGTPVVSDNCGVASVTNNAPASFPLGTTTVTWTVTDSTGNSTTATQIVTVLDTLKPAIYLQGNVIATGITGPSSSKSPYLKSFKPGMQFKSILTTGDVSGTYKMAGIPDGLGAFDNGNGTFTALMNHEIGNTLGVVRAHGSKGTFVSKWIINKSDLSVVSGSDLMQQAYLWNTTSQSFVLAAPGVAEFSRFCSADLPALSAFYNTASGKGTTERIYMNGEESGNEGRAMGHIVTGPDAGKSYELPYLGKFSWENSVASPVSSDKTIVGGMDDGTGGQVYFYIGNKTTTGTDIEKAGLHNGKLYGVKVAGLLTEVSGGVPAAGTAFSLADLGFVQNKTGLTLNNESVAAGVTTFLRPEDGAWDPSNPNDFYFATTNAFGAATPTRLWRLRFTNIATPELGGTIEAVLTGAESDQRMFDNFGIDKKGHMLLQEDVGNNVHIGKVWQYNIATDSLFKIAYHDSTRFINGQPNFLTQDEESSGMLDVSDIFGQGTFLLDVQSHNGSSDPELVEGGQFLFMYNPYAIGNSTAPDTVRSSAGCGATINLGTPATADNCSVASVINNAPSSYPLGTTIVTWTVTDGSGNSTTVDQVVIVTDSIAPSITAPAAVNVATTDGCSAAGFSLGTPVVSDNCGVASVTNNAPSSFPLGTTTVTWTVTDSTGNSATSTQIVTVSDTLKPAIYLQSNVIATGITGPSSSQSPYLKSFKPGMLFKSILTVGDAAGTYRMAGIPDGLGAFDNGNGTFTALMNHEIGNTLGVVRAHGSKGTFVSKWIINKSDLSVVSGSDLMQQAYLWNTGTQSFVLATPGTAAFSRFCSADLPAASAFYNTASGKGTTERIFMNGEESGNEGRAVGHIVTGVDAGKSYELPYLGKFSWENSVASPVSSDKTIVGGMDDGTGGQVYFYIGNKTTTGTDIEKAGLHNGKLYGVKVTGLLTEVNGSVPVAGTSFTLADLGFVQNKTGLTLNTESVAAGVTTFLRPEDGAWDPSNPNDFYFATTNAFGAATPTRIWRLRFTNIATPELGGTIEAVLTGAESDQRMFDNFAIDKKGHILLQEDVGNNVHIGKVWQYNIATDSLFKIAYHDSTRFISGQPNFLTQDEESSGVLDVSDIFGQGAFLLDVQSHNGLSDPELVEGGQFLFMYNPYAIGNSTALDTVRVTLPFGSTSATGINLGTPATADNCSVSSVTNNAPSTYPLGTTIVTWTVTDGSGNTASVNQVVIVTVSANVAPLVTITSPANPATFNAGDPITIVASATDTDGSITKVEFFANGGLFATDSVAPYSVAGTDVEPGIYKVTAKATDNAGTFTVSDTLTVTVIGCNGSGTITGEGFTNITGSQVADLTSSPAFISNSPDITVALGSFEYSNVTDNYGARVRGYICAPVTGDYLFHIAGDDQAGLWLSTNENPANKVLIAYAESYTGFREWYKFPTQTSAAVHLVKGARYYIETLHKEATQNDHLSVGWTIPGGAFEGPIPGSRLSPIGSSFPNVVNVSGAQAFAVAMQGNTNIAGGLKVTATPNPTTTYFTIKTVSSSNQPLTLKVVDALGRVVETKVNFAANGTIQIGDRLPAGLYFVEVMQGEQKQKLKLVKQ